MSTPSAEDAIPMSERPPCPDCGVPLSVIVWGLIVDPPRVGEVHRGCAIRLDEYFAATHQCERCGWQGIPAGWPDPSGPTAVEREAADALASALVASLADGSICVLNWGDVYAQWAPDLPGALVVELVSNQFLPDDRQLGPFDERRLAALGFAAPIGDRPNWHTWVADPVEAGQVAADMVRALVEVYRVEPAELLEEIHSGQVDW
jgi:hypothetical protein